MTPSKNCLHITWPSAKAHRPTVFWVKLVLRVFVVDVVGFL